MPLSSKNIILSGVKTAWIYDLVDGSPDTFSLKYSIDNLANASMRLPISATGTETENVDVTSADGGIVRFPKESYIIGPDDVEIATENGGINASGLGEMTLVLNASPIESTSNTQFVADLQDEKDSTFLIVVPMGYTFDRVGTGVNKKPDGFAYMFGKRSNDLDLSFSSANSTLTLTFAAQKQSWFGATSKAFTGEGIAIKRGGSGKDIPASVNIPIDLDSDDIANLKLGKVVIIETPAA